MNDVPPSGTDEYRWFMRGAAYEAAVRDDALNMQARELRSVFELLCQREPNVDALDAFARTLHIFVAELSPIERWRVLALVWFGSEGFSFSGR